MSRNATPRNAREAQNREAALAVLAAMRRKRRSLRAAAKDQSITPRTVLRFVGSAIFQKGGRYRAKPFDRIPRVLDVPTPHGRVVMTIRDSRTASRIAEYSNALKAYSRGRDASVLEPFRGITFQAQGVSHRLTTDTRTLDRLADSGDLAFENLYRVTQGMAN